MRRKRDVDAISEMHTPGETFNSSIRRTQRFSRVFPVSLQQFFTPALRLKPGADGSKSAKKGDGL